MTTVARAKDWRSVATTALRALCALAMFASGPVLAQGTVGGQGFGYPVSQQGARAAGTAGAFAAFDPVSPVNPAAVAEWRRQVVFFHYEPEYRSSSTASGESSTMVARFPLAGVATGLGSRLSAAATFSTYLDRTWETAATSVGRIGDRDVEITTTYASNGAINDVRAALAWRANDAFRAGAAWHAYTGENRLSIEWDFPDGEPFGDVTQQTSLSYGGSAISVGFEASALREWSVAAYYRAGGEVRLRASDTLISTGDMPDHLGAAVRYTGLAGTVLAASWEKVDWTAMQSLGTSSLGVRDGSRFSVGLEGRGPEIGGRPTALRAGFAQRDLPFDAAQSGARETLYAIGMGYTLGSGLGSIDAALQRASRAAGGVRESAWLLSLGITISP